MPDLLAREISRAQETLTYLEELGQENLHRAWWFQKKRKQFWRDYQENLSLAKKDVGFEDSAKKILDVLDCTSMALQGQSDIAFIMGKPNLAWRLGSLAGVVDRHREALRKITGSPVSDSEIFVSAYHHQYGTGPR